MSLTQIKTSNIDDTGSGLNFRNRIINGGMVFDQRNGGASVSYASTGVYTLDRWRFFITQASKFTVQRNAGSVTPPIGFTNYMGITSTSAYSSSASDYFTLVQGVEGFNVSDFGWGTENAKTVTLSFWVRSSLTGTFSGGITNAGYNRTYSFSYTISAPNTWEQKVITIAGDTTGTWLTDSNRGLEVDFDLGSGSNLSGALNTWNAGWSPVVSGSTSVVGTSGATFYITGVQLEEGNAATAFERRPYGTELALCQRYYEIGGNGAVGAFNNTTQAWVSWTYKITKRATATTGFVTNALIQDPGNTTFTGTSWGSVQNNTVSAVTGLFGGFSGATQNRVCIAGNDSLYASAEL